ncbi:hypothetical protein L0F81_22345 [Streptomyces tricolor]|uniref:CobQ/CobB/MinD/ParA nucleotide binding domain-containing protein n=1 Tax=Streptomyces tricolor TaxID=68277 RepID=A0ABS9JKA6_9ACTN|nr:hypothetical protein [Streptomyces tricolor]MCG0066003.1 hypothetical protein [Streptomyces tricolor]
MAASGGNGRSTTASLLASGLASSGSTVVLDLSPRLSSPWPARLAEQGADGLAALPPDQPLTRTAVQQACATATGTNGSQWHVLSDGREWHAQPLTLPGPPAAWYQLAAIGGWQVVVADTVHPLGHDLLAARCSGEPGLTRGWYGLPYAVPVVCAAATADGVQALQQAVMALHAEGMPLQRTVVVLVGTSDGRPPAPVRAGATMLSARTAAVVQLPYDPNVRAHGLMAARLRTRTRQAAAYLTRAVLAAAHAAWGEPLPGAPQPAPLQPVVPAL